MQGNTSCSCTMTKHSHLVGITTKVRNIVMDPRQCLNLQRKCTLSVSYRGERLVLFTQSLTLLLWWDFSLLFVKKEREVKYRIYWNKRLPHSIPVPLKLKSGTTPNPFPPTTLAKKLNNCQKTELSSEYFTETLLRYIFALCCKINILLLVIMVKI